MQNENAPPILNSLAIVGYRSFGDDLQVFPKFSKINILIGQNNCGKSNVLRFIHDWLAKLPQRPRPSLAQHDRHLPVGSGGIKYGVLPPFFCDGEINISALCSHFQIRNGFAQQITLCKLFTERSQATSGKEEPWLIFDEYGNIQESNWKDAFNSISTADFETLRSHLGIYTGSSRNPSWAPETLKRLAPPFPTFQCHLIPAIRRIGSKGSNAEDFSGEGIIERLAKLQNPSALEQHDKERFRQIGDFLRTVTNNGSAEIEIPHHRETINVRMDGKTLPLESLGSGIHEVIILAAAATVLENCVICMEEPELHLNPSKRVANTP